MEQVFVILSFIFSIIPYYPYVMAIWKTRNDINPVRPQRASWFVWWIIDGVLAWALISAGAWNIAPVFIAFTTGSTVVLVLSLKYGEGGFSALDIFCVLLAVTGIVIWRLQDQSNPSISVLANMFAATIATVPTIFKAYKKPESEDKLTWRLFMIGGFFAVLAIPTFTFINTGPAITVFSLQIGINLAIYFGSKKTIKTKLI